MNIVMFKYFLLFLSVVLVIFLLHRSETITSTGILLTQQPIINHTIPLYFSTWHECAQQKFISTGEDANVFWKNFKGRSQECDKVAKILKNMKVVWFKNRDETKYAILPVRKSSKSVFVTLGIGLDISAEEAFQKKMRESNQVVTFYGADPIVEGNAQMYSKIGKFFPFAVGAKAGFSKASVLRNDVYQDVDVVHVDLYYFLSEVLGEKIIDNLWMDAEYAEYGLLDIFYKDGRLDQMGFLFCQMSLEVHNPSLDQKKQFVNFVEKLVMEKSWLEYAENKFLKQISEFQKKIIGMDLDYRNSDILELRKFRFPWAQRPNVHDATSRVLIAKVTTHSTKIGLLTSQSQNEYEYIYNATELHEASKNVAMVSCGIERCDIIRGMEGSRFGKFWTNHIIQTFYHFGQTLLAFLLMNVFMTFNIYICLSVCLGLSIGHFFFGSRIH